MNIKKFLVFGLFAAVIGTAFANTETDQASATTKKYVMDELSELQTAIPAQSGTKAVTYTTTQGTIAPREVKTNLGTSTSDTAMPTVSAVNTGLNAKQDKVPAIDSNTVATYTSNAGEIGTKGIYQDTGNYAEQQSNLIDAGTFNAALQNALNMEFVCAGYVDDDPTKPCWLWQIHTAEESPLNLYDPATNPIEQGTILSANGQSANGSTRVRTFGYINVEPNTQYTVSESGLNYFMVYEYDTNDNFLAIASLAVWKASPYTFTTSADTGKIRIIFTNNTDWTANNTDYVTPADLQWLQVERGPTATPHPYTTLVPAGYTPLEYIESTGTQYIDTGIAVKSNTGAEFDYQFVGSGSNWVFGQVAGSQYHVMGYRTNGIWWFYPYTNLNLYDNIRHKVVFDADDGTVYKDSIAIANSGQFKNIQPNVTILLFAERNDNNVINKGKVKIYYFKLKEGTIIVRDLIPARRDSDGVLGMYDKVSNTFFTNAGTGTFVAGPEVSNIIYIPQNQ